MSTHEERMANVKARITGTDKVWDPHSDVDWQAVADYEESLGSHSYDGDEVTANLGQEQVPSVFRGDRGEELDWDVILNGLDLKPITDQEAPEEKATLSQRFVRMLHEIRNAEGGRAYQVGWAVDMESPEGNGWQAGEDHMFWLKVPEHGERRQDTAERIVERFDSQRMSKAAKSGREASELARSVRLGLENRLMMHWDRGITHLLVKAVPTVHEGTTFPSLWFTDYKAVQVYTSWADCQTHMREYKAALRARKAASGASKHMEELEGAAQAEVLDAIAEEPLEY